MRDEEIINLYFERSERAIEETDKKYKALCSHVIRNILKDTSDVDECINDTWLGGMEQYSARCAGCLFRFPVPDCKKPGIEKVRIYICSQA